MSTDWNSPTLPPVRGPLWPAVMVRIASVRVKSGRSSRRQWGHGDGDDHVLGKFFVERRSVRTPAVFAKWIGPYPDQHQPRLRVVLLDEQFGFGRTRGTEADRRRRHRDPPVGFHDVVVPGRDGYRAGAGPRPRREREHGAAQREVGVSRGRLRLGRDGERALHAGCGRERGGHRAHAPVLGDAYRVEVHCQLRRFVVVLDRQHHRLRRRGAGAAGHGGGNVQLLVRRRARVVDGGNRERAGARRGAGRDGKHRPPAEREARRVSRRPPA